MKIWEDPKVLEFFIEREIHPETQAKYIRMLRYYIEHSGDGLTPTELIREARQEERAGVYIEDRKITERFLRFKAWLIKQPWGDMTKRITLSLLKTFYKTLHVHEIPSTSIRVRRERQVKASELPTREEVKRAIIRSSPKYGAIFLTMASSGLMQGDIINLKLNEFVESFNEQVNTSFNGVSDIDQMLEIADKREIIIKWEKQRYKNNIEYMTFSSSESCRAILEYLREDPPQSEDDYLFRYEGHQVNFSTFSVYVNKLNQKLKINDYYKRIIPRNLRKRFASILMESEIGYSQIQYMLGHVQSRVDGAYFKLLDEGSMRKAYLKALPKLMILEDVETRILTSDDKAKMDKLEKTVDDLQSQLKGVLLELDKRDGKLPPPG